MRTQHEPYTITLIRKLITEQSFEAELALGVLSLAIQDAQKVYTAKEKSPNYARGKSTISWFKQPDGRFNFWCYHLNLDPEFVRDLIRKEMQDYEQNAKLASSRKRRSKDYAHISR
jgi:hypothetical protein